MLRVFIQYYKYLAYLSGSNAQFFMNALIDEDREGYSKRIRPCSCQNSVFFSFNSVDSRYVFRNSFIPRIITMTTLTLFDVSPFLINRFERPGIEQFYTVINKRIRGNVALTKLRELITRERDDSLPLTFRRVQTSGNRQT